jgi:hypothetical protein
MDNEVNQINVSEPFVFQIIRVNISKQTFDLLPKYRFNVYNPTIGLVNDFSKFNSVIAKRQTLKYKKD